MSNKNFDLTFAKSPESFMTVKTDEAEITILRDNKKELVTISVNEFGIHISKGFRDDVNTCYNGGGSYHIFFDEFEKPKYLTSEDIMSCLKKSSKV